MVARISQRSKDRPLQQDHCGTQQGEVTMAYQGASDFKQAKGDKAATGMQKTPAPVVEDQPIPGSFGKMDRGNRFANNGFAGASSLAPGKRISADGIRAQVDDPVLERVVAEGSRPSEYRNDQTREISAEPYRPHNAMVDPNRKNQKVPGSLIDQPQQPPEKP
jgi:hypothetical protein